jgi:hypothetical protein
MFLPQLFLPDGSAYRVYDFGRNLSNAMHALGVGRGLGQDFVLGLGADDTRAVETNVSTVHYFRHFAPPVFFVGMEARY